MKQSKPKPSSVKEADWDRDIPSEVVVDDRHRQHRRLLRQTLWSQSLLTRTAITVTVIAALYWAQSVFIPIALALFFSFLLNPLVRKLERTGFGRTPSVLCVVTLAVCLLLTVSTLIGRQLTSVVAELPVYSDNIIAKIDSLRASTIGTVASRVQVMADRIGRSNERSTDEAEERAESKETAPSPQPTDNGWVAWAASFLRSLMSLLGVAALALLLVVFMLLNQEDLRDRFIRLMGPKQLTSTTRAVDDGLERVSRYLAMQAVVNASYGVIMGVGLFLLGVKYALVWGVISGVIRYVPYLGPWIGAVFPVALSLAIFEGWQQPMLVIGFIIVLELVSNNLMEPMLYGHSIGASTTGFLVAAAFWTFMWGVVGLLLSAPLTVGLVVMGKYVPRLRFLYVLFGDEPALDKRVRFYQRVLAGDVEEAIGVVADQYKNGSAEQVYDQILAPALVRARRATRDGELTAAEEDQMRADLERVLQNWKEQRAEQQLEPVVPELTTQPIRVVAYPARDESDRLALVMLQQMLDGPRWDVDVIDETTLAGESAQQVAEEQPHVVCIASLPPGGYHHSLYLCKRIRARSEDTRIVVLRWGIGASRMNEEEQRLHDAGADLVTTTLTETKDQLNSWSLILAPAASR